MKQIKLIFLGLALLMGFLLAGVNGTEVLYPSISSAGEKIVPYDKSDEIEYGYGGTYDIGTYVNNDSDTCTVRTQYEFDLSSIDNHANITKVTVYYAMDEKSYTFKLTEMSSAEDFAEEIWNAVASGSTLNSGKSYEGSSFESDELKTSVSNALDDDMLILGVMSEAEGSLNSYADMWSIYIEVEYTIPILNLTVKNNLYEENGGNVGVAIYPEPVDSHASPYSFTAYEEDKLNLQAYDNQPIDNKIWFFNDTEYGEESSKWKKKKSSGSSEVLTHSHEYITAKLTSSDDNAVFVAYLKNVSYTTAGNLQSNESWLLSEAVLTGDVNVPANTTLTLGPNVSVNLNNYKIESTGGTINVLEGAELSSNIQIRNSNDAIQGLYPSISSAISNAASGEKVCLFDECNLTSNVSVPSNIVLELGAVNKITMNGYKIVSAGGTINIDYNADIDPFIVHKNTSGKIVGLYPDLSSAMAAVTPFNEETVEINSQYDVSSNVTIPLESTLIIKSNASLDIDSSNKITKPSLAFMTIESGAEINPDFRLKSGSTLTGFYGSISGAFADGSYVEARDTIEMAADISVPSGKTLKLISGAKLRSATGKYLKVYGTLNASSASFRKISGNWGGIKFQSGSNGSIDNCTISGASYGVYCNGASPSIEDNTISDCAYGIYAYNCSPFMASNRINSKMYLNNSESEIYNNKIQSSFYMYGADPILDNNTIESDAIILIEADNGSMPEFGGGSQGTFGFNKIVGSDDADFTVLAEDGAYVLLGTGNAGPYCPSQNTILGGMFPCAEVDGTGYIEADWCWWGQSTAPMCLGNVSTEDPLPFIPSGTGSSLNKTITGGLEAGSKDDESIEKAEQAICEGNYAIALDILEAYLVESDDNSNSCKALGLIRKIHHKYLKTDAVETLTEMAEFVKDADLSKRMQSFAVSEMIRQEKYKQAISLSELMLEEEENSLRELTALFDLFNIYDKDFCDKSQARLYWDMMKNKYPDSKLCYIASLDMGEEVDDICQAKSLYEMNFEESTGEFDHKDVVVTAAYPNPFNPITTIHYNLPVASNVDCDIFNLSGSLVKSYTMNQSAGQHNLQWNASSLTSGLYFIRLSVKSLDGSGERYTQYQKVTLLK